MKNFTKKILMMLTVALFINGQSFAQNELTGKVLYHLNNNKPISQVTVTLIDSNGYIAGVTATDLSGSYSFSEVPTGIYSIEASTDIMAGGINMADANKIKHHLRGNQQLDEFEQLAADVDFDSQITWADYDAIVDWHMQGIPFNSGHPWVFMTLQNIEHTYTELKTLTNVPTVGGSSSGDVNGTFVPTTRDLAESMVKYTQKPISNDFSVEIFATDIIEASAMGLIINYPANMVNISNITSQLGEIMAVIKNGQIRIGWINESVDNTPIDSELPILVISGNTTGFYDGSEIKFKVDPTSHFCDQNSNEIATRFSLPILTQTENYLGMNYPNPFRGITTIDYSIPVDGKVNISLYNQMGQLIRVLIDSPENNGIHSLRFDSEGLEPGIYYYTLKTSGRISINETKRMIITR